MEAEAEKNHTQRLQLAGEFRCAGDDGFDLLFAFGPRAAHRRFFPGEVGLHLLELLGDRCHPFVELRAGEILEDSRFLVVLIRTSGIGNVFSSMNSI